MASLLDWLVMAVAELGEGNRPGEGRTSGWVGGKGIAPGPGGVLLRSVSFSREISTKRTP